MSSLRDDEMIINPDGTLSFKEFVGTGTIKVNPWFLNGDNPLHPYNMVVNRGLVPEDYGIEHPDQAEMAEYADWSRSRLVAEIIRLRRDLEAGMRSGF